MFAEYAGVEIGAVVFGALNLIMAAVVAFLIPQVIGLRSDISTVKTTLEFIRSAISDSTATVETRKRHSDQIHGELRDGIRELELTIAKCTTCQHVEGSDQ